jgi:hypothetical protein
MSMTEALEMTSCRSRSSSSEVHAFTLNFFVSVSPGQGHLKASNEPGRVALVRGCTAPGACRTDRISFGAELVERHGAGHRDPFV